MKNFQNKFSIILAAIISIFSSILLLFISFLETTILNWTVFFIFLIALFLFTYMILSIANQNFIFDGLFEILNSIIHARNNKDLRKHYPTQENIIEDIQNEVKGWSDDKKNESDRLKKLELYRKEYIGNVSHELKTPVFNIQGYILTLLDGGLDDPKVNRDFLVRADKSVERMIHIIEDLESISQLETGELTLEIERFDIVAMAKDVCEGQEMNATTKGIIFSFITEEPIFVMADRFRIRQVFTNLVVNSIKYGKEYGETQLRIAENNDSIKVEISDNGIGISQEYLPRLFERFYRVDKSRSREQGGTGLGLSIVKHILEAHGQNISTTSKLGEGTTFTFYLHKA